MESHLLALHGRQPVTMSSHWPPAKGANSSPIPAARQVFPSLHYLSSFVGEGILSLLSRSGFGQIPGSLSLFQGHLLNNAPPVPNAFVGVPVCPWVPPQGRALVPTLDRDYCDHTRHLLTYYTSRMAFASDFRPGEIPKSLGVLM